MEDAPLTRESLNGQAYARLCRAPKAPRFAPADPLKLPDPAPAPAPRPPPLPEPPARPTSPPALPPVRHPPAPLPLLDAERLAPVRPPRLLL